MREKKREGQSERCKMREGEREKKREEEETDSTRSLDVSPSFDRVTNEAVACDRKLVSQAFRKLGGYVVDHRLPIGCLVVDIQQQRFRSIVQRDRLSVLQRRTHTSVIPESRGSSSSSYFSSSLFSYTVGSILRDNGYVVLFFYYFLLYYLAFFFIFSFSFFFIKGLNSVR